MEEYLKASIEALLFVHAEAMSIKRISEILEIEYSYAKTLLSEMQESYLQNQRGIQLIEVQNSVQLVTKPQYKTNIEKLYKESKGRGLSQSSIEVLSVVAYRQPVSKQEVDYIRGVKSDKQLQTLTEFGLVTITGRLDRVGKPYTYGTTDLFLKKFGFKSIKELPELQALKDLQLTLFDETELGDNHGTGQ